MATNNKSGGSSKQTPKKPSVPDFGKKPSGNKANKTTDKTRTTKKESVENENTLNRQRIAIIFAAVSAVLFAVTLIPGESAWLAIHNLSFRIFGMCMFVIPVVFLYLAVVYAKNNSIGSAVANLAGGGLFAVVACMLIHIISKLGAITDTGEKYLSSYPALLKTAAYHRASYL